MAISTTPDPRYTINCRSASESEAREHWYQSDSFASANNVTRNSIWLNAHRPDGGPYGEINWLIEAGVQIIQEQNT
jgi:hypothetical protein